jgi:hypothetical protein
VEDLQVMRPSSAIGLFAALAACSGNGPAHALEGSLGDEMDLGYDEAVLMSSTGQFSISFNRKKGMGFDTVFQIGVTVEMGEKVTGGTTWDLAQVLSNGMPRGTLSRNVLDDPRTTFPPFRNTTDCTQTHLSDGGHDGMSCAELGLDNIPAEGQNLPAGGNFHVTFANGVEFASGRTVFGTFAAKFP